MNEYLLEYVPGFDDTFDFLEIDDDNYIRINLEEADENKSEVVDKWVDNVFMNRVVCPYCGTALDSSDFDFNKDMFDIPDDVYDELPSSYDFDLWSCPNCIYWQIYIFETFPDEFDYGYIHNCFMSKLRRFTSTLPEGVGPELAQYLRRKPQAWHSLTPKALELLVAAIFKANFADSEVLHVGKSHDGGVDVIFIDYNHNQCMIQVKCRQSARKAEGFETVQNLLGAMVLKDSSYGIIATTADHFSYWAVKARTEALRRGKIIRLLDKGKLNRMLDHLIPERPWFELLKFILPQAASHFLKTIPSHKQGCFDFLYEPKE